MTDTMSPLKKKKDLPAVRLNPVTFVGLWALTCAIGWAALFIFWQQTSYAGLTDLMRSLVIAVMPVVISAFLQSILLRWALNPPVRHWLPVSLAGAIAGGLVFYGFQDMSLSYPDNVSMAIMLAMLMTPVALAQSLLLLKRTRSAPVWVLAGLVSAAAFALPVPDDDLLPVLIGAVLQGSVMGLTLLWLWQQATAKHAAT